MIRVLVTGSQGYIGSVLCDKLRAHGYHVKGLDTGFFRHSTLAPVYEGETLIDKDMRCFEYTDLDSTDVVVHLAGISNDPMHAFDEEEVYGPTRIYTKLLAQMCKERGVRFIFASSCSVYGIGGDSKLTEQSEVNPQTGYSRNKVEIEEDLVDLAGDDFCPIILRFATIFGFSPRIRFDVVANMFAGMAVTEKRILLNSDGQAWRPNLHILDACASIIGAIQTQIQEPRAVILNVGSDRNNLKILDMANAVASVVPGCTVEFLSQSQDCDPEGLIQDRKVDPLLGDVRTYSVSFDKIQSVIPTFNCAWDFFDGVEALVEDFQTAGLTREIFKSVGFYRLQKLEQLLSDGYLSSELRWKRSFV